MILIELSYSDHVPYISFIFFRLPFCHETHPIFYGEGSVFKCQNSSNNNADDTLKEENVRRGKRKSFKEKKREDFRSQNYYAVM